MKYLCFDCDRIFTKPRQCTETHGLAAPPYETYYCCPYCGGDYAETYECDVCGRYINGEYIKLANGERICENCYTKYELGEE